MGCLRSGPLNAKDLQCQECENKIRADNVMPEILELLKRDRLVSKPRIEERMLEVAQQKGLAYRTQAVGFSLTALRRIGWARSEQGDWSITDSGMKASLTEDQVRSIGRSLWPPTTRRK